MSDMIFQTAKPITKFSYELTENKKYWNANTYFHVSFSFCSDKEVISSLNFSITKIEMKLSLSFLPTIAFGAYCHGGPKWGFGELLKIYFRALTIFKVAEADFDNRNEVCDLFKWDKVVLVILDKFKYRQGQSKNVRKISKFEIKYAQPSTKARCPT